MTMFNKFTKFKVLPDNRVQVRGETYTYAEALERCDSEDVRACLRDGIQRQSDTRYLGELRRLRLKPDDMIVIKVEGSMTEGMAAKIKEQATAFFGERKVLVHDSGLEIGVISPEKAA